MANRIIFRKNSELGWLRSGIVLATGEPGFAVDTETLKIGNGSDLWPNLPYITANPLGNVGTEAIVPGGGAAFSGPPNSIVYSQTGTSIRGSTGLQYSVGSGITMDVLSIASTSNKIVLNSSGTAITSQTGSFYVNPVRGIQVDINSPFVGLNVGGETFYQSFYNPLTSEFIYVTTGALPPPPPAGIDALTLDTPFTSAALSVPTAQSDYYTTARKLSFAVPTTGDYVFTFSGISSILYQVLITSTAGSMYQDSLGLSPSSINSGETYALTGGNTLYFLPEDLNGQGSAILNITVSVPVIPPDFITLGNPYSIAPGAINVSTPTTGLYTTPYLIAFLVPTTGNYAFTFSGISGALNNVLSTTTASTIFTDSNGLTPSNYVSGQSYSLTQGTTIYLLPVDDGTSTAFSLQVDEVTSLLPDFLELDTTFTTSVLSAVTSSAGLYTIPNLLAFVVPATGYYSFTFLGTSVVLYNVLSSSTPSSMFTDSATIIPSTFDNQVGYSFNEGTTIYLLPTSTDNTQAIGISVSAVSPPPPQPVIIPFNSSFTSSQLTSEAPFSTYTTPSLLVFEVPSTGDFIFTFSGIDGSLYQVGAGTTPASLVTDSANYTPSTFTSGTPYPFNAGQSIYLLPTNSTNMESLSLMITSGSPPPPQPTPITFNVEYVSELLETPTPNSGFNTLSYVLSFTPPTTNFYTFTFSGIGGSLYQVASNSTAGSIYDDAGFNNPQTFTSGTPYPLVQGSTVYLMPDDDIGNARLTITITSPPTPPSNQILQLGVPFSSAAGDFSELTEQNNYTTPYKLQFTAPRDGSYAFTFTGIDGSLFNVLSSSTPNTMYYDSNQKNPPAFASETRFSLSAQETIFMLPEGLLNNVQITITANLLEVSLPIDSAPIDEIMLSEETSSGNFTTPYLLTFTPPTTGAYSFTFSGASTLYQVSSVTTPQTIYNDTTNYIPSTFTSGVKYSFVGGTKIYLMPDNSTGTTLTMLASSFSFSIVPLTLGMQHDSAPMIQETGVAGKYTTAYSLALNVEIAGMYKFTYTGSDTLYNVLSSSFTTSMYEDSSTLTPSTFTSGVAYPLSAGTYYVMPETSTLNSELALTAVFLSAFVNVDETFNTVNLTENTPSDKKTTPFSLKFNVPSSGAYSFAFTGADILYQVLETTIASGIYTESGAQPYPTFSNTLLYYFNQGQTIYILPEAPAEVTNPVFSLTIGYLSSFGGQTVTQGVNYFAPEAASVAIARPGTNYGKFTTPFVIDFTAPEAGNYVVSWSSGADSLARVLSSTTAETFNQDYSGSLISGSTVYLAGSETVYLMPLNDSPGSTLGMLFIDLQQ